MDNYNKVEVVICGEVVTLVGTESEEYILRLAKYIDKKILDVTKNKPALSVNSHLRTTFIAINIADDYFKEIERNKELLEQSDAMTQEIAQLKARVKTLEDELAASKDELDEYIREFDSHTAAANTPQKKHKYAVL